MNLENRTILYLSDKPYATVWLRNSEKISRLRDGDVSMAGYPKVAILAEKAGNQYQRSCAGIIAV